MRSLPKKPKMAKVIKFQPWQVGYKWPTPAQAEFLFLCQEDGAYAVAFPSLRHFTILRSKQEQQRRRTKHKIPAREYWQMVERGWMTEGPRSHPTPRGQMIALFAQTIALAHGNSNIESLLKKFKNLPAKVAA